MNEPNPINVAVVALAVVAAAWWACTLFSPDAMDSLARRLRARARAMRSSREHWKLAYRESLHMDLSTERERADFNRIVGADAE